MRRLMRWQKQPPRGSIPLSGAVGAGCRGCGQAGDQHRHPPPIILGEKVCGTKHLHAWRLWERLAAQPAKLGMGPFDSG